MTAERSQYLKVSNKKKVIFIEKTSCFFMMQRCISVFVLTLACFFPDSAFANDRENKMVLNLDQCIKKAVDLSPEIGESRHEEDVYKSKKMQADAAAYPQIELLAITGPSPKARKEHLFSDDKPNSTINGIFGSADITLIQPIYTFGKISSYKQAAEGGVKVAGAGVHKKTSDIVLRTKELYYSLLLAKDMRNLILEIKDKLADSIKKTEKHLEMGSPWADELNLYKLKAFLGEANRNLNETDKGIALAKDAIMTTIGLPRDIEFDIEDASLTPEDRMPEKLNNYIEKAKEKRPEFVQIAQGLIARKALIDAEKSAYYPLIFAGIKASIAGATNRDKIENPYIPDYFNHAYGAVFMGVKWSLDFGITDGKVSEARAEYLKLTEKKRFAEDAIPLQIRKAYLDFEEAGKNILETEAAYSNTRKWLVSAIANFDLGIGEAKEIADAAMAYVMMKANYLRSVYNHRMSYANLLYAAGIDSN